MTLISNDPSWWPLIKFYRVGSYFAVASSIAVIYDWALTFGREVELFWRHRWSLVTGLYLVLRYTGILFSVINILWFHPSLSLTDVGCKIFEIVQFWTSNIMFNVLGVIMITRLHAMYQRSRKMLIFLVAVFLAAAICCGILLVKITSRVSGEELVLSGTHQCTYYNSEGDVQLLIAESWMVVTVWELLALCLAVWIVAQHFHELQRQSIGWTARGCFTILIQSYLLYFAIFTAVSCFNLGLMSPNISDSSSVGAQAYYGILQILVVVHMFVLGPRLILGVREYHAKLLANSDEGTGMVPLAFQERLRLPNSSSV